MNINWKQIWEGVRTYVLNKYIITVIVFVLIFLFAGEQSLIKDMKRSRRIHETEQEIAKSTQAIREARRKINSLHQTDSLEKFGREEYLMHQDNEDIYLVDEP